MRIFQLQGFVLAQGRHVARLRVCPDVDGDWGEIRRSALWSRAEEARSDIAAALALPANHRVLFALAGVPDDCEVEWTMRESGSAGAMDLVALVRRSSGGHHLLLVDCVGTRTSPARLREQMAQAVRTALATFAKVSLPDRQPWTKLVVLSGWRRGVPVPTEAKPLPALQREPAVLETVPEPQVWGHVAFVRADRPEELHVAFGLWREFDEPPWNGLPPEAVAVPWQNFEPLPIDGYGKGAQVEVEKHHDRVRVSLRVRASAHKASLKQDKHGSHVARRVRALRASCYAGHFTVGLGRFVGETIEDGIPRLHWDWIEGHSPGAEAARDEVVTSLKAFAAVGQPYQGNRPGSEGS